MGGQDGYRQMLSDGRWKKRRMEIMRRDGFRCQRCGTRGELNVHHRWYAYGHKPWEYPDRCLVTLCRRCHRRVHLTRTLWKIITVLLMLAAAYAISTMNR